MSANSLVNHPSKISKTLLVAQVGTFATAIAAPFPGAQVVAIAVQ